MLRTARLHSGRNTTLSLRRLLSHHPRSSLTVDLSSWSIGIKRSQARRQVVATINTQCHQNRTHQSSHRDGNPGGSALEKKSTQRQQGFLSHTRRCYTSSSPFASSWYESLKNFVGSVMVGDDHINPQRILERRYLLLALTLLKLRELRQDVAQGASAMTMMTDEPAPSSYLAELQWQAIQELDQNLKVDGLSNAQLRLEYHKAIQPQVRHVFETFQTIDAQLGLAFDVDSKEDDDDEDPHRRLFQSLNWSQLHGILQDDWERTRHELAQCHSSQRTESGVTSRVAFLELKEQALHTLLHFHGLESTALPQTDSNAWVDVFGMKHQDEMDNDPERWDTIRRYQTINFCRSRLLRDELGYSILCLRSSIPNGGRGCFVDGQVQAGDLVAFQPGEVWPKEYLMVDDDPELMEHFADNPNNPEEDCQTSVRFDDFVVDTRWASVTVLCQPLVQTNPWALGHMVNHPPAKVIPNVQSLMLNFSTKDIIRPDSNLVAYIPNVYARPPTWKSRLMDVTGTEDGDSVLMHGLCLVARRDSRQEEIYYDYRLQTTETPGWYHSVEYGDEFLDKERVVFFRNDWREK